VENKTELMKRVLKMQQISLLSKYIKLISRGVFLRVFIRAGVDLKEVKMVSLLLGIDAPQ
jgi:hypothetical protein